MRYVCDAPGDKTWFRIETQVEAALETQAMSHAVEKYFIQAQERAARSYVAPAGPFIERDIGLKAHIQRAMPMFLEFRVCGARLRQRSLFDRDVYGSWRAADVGFEPLIMRRRRSRAVLYHEQGRFSCGLRARGGRPGYRRTGGQARP